MVAGPRDVCMARGWRLAPKTLGAAARRNIRMADDRIQRIRLRRRHSGAVLGGGFVAETPFPDPSSPDTAASGSSPPKNLPSGQTSPSGPPPGDCGDADRSLSDKVRKRGRTAPPRRKRRLRRKSLDLKIVTRPISHRATIGTGGVMVVGELTMEGGEKWIRLQNTGTERTGPKYRRRHRAITTLPRRILNKVDRPMKNPRSHDAGNRPPIQP